MRKCTHIVVARLSICGSMKTRPTAKCTWQAPPKNNPTGIVCKTMVSADVLWSLTIVSRYHCHAWDGNSKPISMVASRVMRHGGDIG